MARVMLDAITCKYHSMLTFLIVPVTKWCRAHRPFDRSDRMLDGMPPDRPHVRRMVRNLEHLVEMSHDVTCDSVVVKHWACTCHQWALLAIQTPVTMKSQPTLPCCTRPGPTFMRPAGILILPYAIDNCLLAEPSFDSGSRGDRLWADHCDTCFMTCVDFFALEVLSTVDPFLASMKPSSCFEINIALSLISWIRTTFIRSQRTVPHTVHLMRCLSCHQCRRSKEARWRSTSWPQTLSTKTAAGIGYHLIGVVRSVLLSAFNQYRTRRLFDDFYAGRRVGPTAHP